MNNSRTFNTLFVISVLNLSIGSAKISGASSTRLCLLVEYEK